MIASLGTSELLWVSVIVMIAAGAQMVSGFGFALMAVPLMGLAIDLKTAVVVSTICGTASNTFQAVSDGRHRDVRLVRTLIAASFVGMPFGILLLDHVEVGTLQVIIGFVVLFALAVVVFRPSLGFKGGMMLEALAGVMSGVLATSTSTNGPPLVLLLKARGLSPDAFRATINTVFSVIAFTSVAVFAVAGRVTTDVAAGTLVGVPGLVVGMFVGARVRGALPVHIFWRLVAALLVAAATSSIVSGLA
jgi:uncharacterized membrane protein YfcA